MGASPLTPGAIGGDDECSCRLRWLGRHPLTVEKADRHRPGVHAPLEAVRKINQSRVFLL
jgi:hypothetical protein